MQRLFQRLQHRKRRMESYKGIFIDEDTAAKTTKAIAYVPSEMKRIC